MARKWRCFHCDDVFHDRAAAAQHFGKYDGQEPACMIDIAAFRAMEEAVAKACAEDTDTDRRMQAMLSEHRPALVREEERGFEKGMKAVVGYLDALRADEGDYVTICCDNPEAASLDVQVAIDCFGIWTDFKDRRFLGATVVECLEKAATARKAAESALAAKAAWKGPGTDPHEYDPDIMAMGDCRVCGHTEQAHGPKPALPGPTGRLLL